MARRNMNMVQPSTRVEDVQRIVTDFRKEFHQRVKTLCESINILNPLNEEDAKLIKTSVRMLQSIDQEITDAESVAQLSDIIDVDRLVNNWGTIGAAVSDNESHTGALGKLFEMVSEE